MAKPGVEYAGGATPESVYRRAVLNRAPAWWRSIVEQETPTTTPTPSAPTPRAKPRKTRSKPTTYAGWLAGVCAPGMSDPAYSEKDGLRIREEFTPECVREMLRGAERLTTPVTLQWKHRGITLASTSDLSLVLRRHDYYGIEFEAWLPPSKWSDVVLGMAERTGLGVSLGYRMRKWSHVDRNGGKVRRIESAELDHVAVVPESDGLQAYFVGARAYGKRGHALGCPDGILHRARVVAFNVLADQAKRNA